jgi:hypothetical protein
MSRSANGSWSSSGSRTEKRGGTQSVLGSERLARTTLLQRTLSHYLGLPRIERSRHKGRQSRKSTRLHQPQPVLIVLGTLQLTRTVVRFISLGALEHPVFNFLIYMETGSEGRRDGGYIMAVVMGELRKSIGQMP